VLTITITGPEGQTITTNNPAILSGAVRRMLNPLTVKEVGKHATLMRELQEGHYLAAGNVAAELMLRLYVAEAEVTPPEYVVPVDPADETQQECCQ
jgi:hypothetical protein